MFTSNIIYPSRYPPPHFSKCVTVEKRQKCKQNNRYYGDEEIRKVQ